MKSTPFAAAALFAALSTASAQNITASGNSSTPLTVNVGLSSSGAAGLVFNPPSFNATNGTLITFVFDGVPGNHSVTQSAFNDPCDPLENGFDSGWVFIPNGTAAGFPTWNLTITNDQKPIWFYCKQLKPAAHCDAGMVGAINAPITGNNTFEAFQTKAKSLTSQPGQGIGFLVGQGASASSGPGPFSGSITAVGVPTAAVNSTGSSASASGSASAGSGSGSGGSGSNGAMGLSMLPAAFTVLFGAVVGTMLI